MRMHDLACEAFDARMVRRVALVIPVVAGAREQEAARHLLRLAGTLGEHPCHRLCECGNASRNRGGYAAVR